MMKIIVSERQYSLIIEQSNNSAESCDKNIGSGAGYLETWKKMDETKRNQVLDSIKRSIDQSLQKSREEYIKWFQNPLTIKKFKPGKESDVLKKIPSYLQSIKKINLMFKGPDSMPTARAWVSTKLPNEIFYNLSQIHDGNDFVGQSIDYTTKHEMGHSIDNFFKANGVDTYINTINTPNQDSYNANYIVNDRDQYTRLNVLRGIINAGPADHPKTLLSKFLSSVKNGTITSDKFTFSGISSKTPPSGKNDAKKATEIFKILQNGIFVHGKNNPNVEQLFSNFGVENGGTVYVSFDSLAQLNITSKDLEKIYYFLKMTPV